MTGEYERGYADGRRSILENTGNTICSRCRFYIAGACIREDAREPFDWCNRGEARERPQRSEKTAPSDRTPGTVFDSLRRMTRQELAAFLSSLVNEECFECPAYDYCRNTGLWSVDETCADKLAEWLNAEPGNGGAS